MRLMRIQLTAVFTLRYNWLLVKPLVLHVLDSVLQDFDAEGRVEVQAHHGNHMCYDVRF